MKKRTVQFIHSYGYYSVVVAYIIFLFIVTIFSLRLFDDVRSLTNTSNSMNPTINAGSITIIKKFPSYDIGDIITYYALIDNKEIIITHRIIDLGGNVYITKGDANQAIDENVILPRSIIGKVIIIIPYLGYIISFTKTALGLWVAVAIPTLSIIYIELSKISKK